MVQFYFLSVFTAKNSHMLQFYFLSVFTALNSTKRQRKINIAPFFLVNLLGYNLKSEGLHF